MEPTARHIIILAPVSTGVKQASRFALQKCTSMQQQHPLPAAGERVCVMHGRHSGPSSLQPEEGHFPLTHLSCFPKISHHRSDDCLGFCQICDSSSWILPKCTPNGKSVTAEDRGLRLIFREFKSGEKTALGRRHLLLRLWHMCAG